MLSDPASPSSVTLQGAPHLRLGIARPKQPPIRRRPQYGLERNADREARYRQVDGIAEGLIDPNKLLVGAEYRDAHG